MTRKELIFAIHKGALKANRNYSKWSGGEWICDYGIEGYMVAEICKSIQCTRRNGYLTMEEPFDNLIENSGKKPTGRRPEIINGSKRIDIAIWNSKNIITHIVEVKREWNNEVGCHDLKRLCELQQKCNKIQCGLFVMLVVSDGGKIAMVKKAEKQIEDIQNHLKCINNRIHRGWEASSVQHENGRIASTLCVEIYGR
ncbi:MAG: hypothetical protein ACEB74_05960 [Desulfovibrio aminophilus]|uniref:hypothetical protein n=1 Tax=Desulfovibrio aminophilus TaxID=81425 RepID=UPI0039E89E8C